MRAGALPGELLLLGTLRVLGNVHGPVGSPVRIRCLGSQVLQPDVAAVHQDHVVHGPVAAVAVEDSRVDAVSDAMADAFDDAAVKLAAVDPGDPDSVGRPVLEVGGHFSTAALTRSS